MEFKQAYKPILESGLRNEFTSEFVQKASLEGDLVTAVDYLLLFQRWVHPDYVVGLSLEQKERSQKGAGFVFSRSYLFQLLSPSDNGFRVHTHTLPFYEEEGVVDYRSEIPESGGIDRLFAAVQEVHDSYKQECRPPGNQKESRPFLGTVTYGEKKLSRRDLDRITIERHNGSILVHNEA